MTTDKKERVDIFHWANQADAHKQEYEIDLFMFTKGYTVYATRYSKEVTSPIRALFLYGIVNSVQTGAATGMKIRDLHTDSDDENVVDFTDIERVENAQAIVEQIAYGEESLDVFSAEDHDMRRIKGLVVRFKLKGQEPFYIFKLLPKSKMIYQGTAWDLAKDTFRPMKAAATIQMTYDEQVLVVGEQIFVFSLSKFTKLFGYDAKKIALLDAKIAEIEKQFKLSYPDGVDMHLLARDNKQLTEKLLRANPESITQDQVIEQADEFGLALMTDDAEGRIIIMDKRDATMFANLLNDDYVDSNMTGIHYLAVKKKEVQATEDAQMGMRI